MGKAPAFQFYIGDWLKDTRILTPLTRGIWIDMLCFMWHAEERGKIEGNKDQLTRLLSCKIEEIDSAVEELKLTRIADVSVTKSLHVTDCNEIVTVINRRMYREENERKLTRCRVQKFRNGKKNTLCNGDVTVPSSSSSSSSIINDSKESFVDRCPHQEIINLFHSVLPELQRVQVWGNDRQSFLRSRWKEKPERQSLEWWETFFKSVGESDFLMGRKPGRDGSFLCTLEWLVRPKNFNKVIEGNYKNRENGNSKKEFWDNLK